MKCHERAGTARASPGRWDICRAGGDGGPGSQVALYLTHVVCILHGSDTARPAFERYACIPCELVDVAVWVDSDERP